mmetsp:Transcript_17319/g.19985  ORF Transcript_17319/g.19985 Transcript_17319/m.19985 type:complete len:162 (-) Transcript_17319:313-798(-)
MLSRKENIASSLLLKAYMVVHKEHQLTRKRRCINLLSIINHAISLTSEICEEKRGLLDWAFQTKPIDYDAIIAFRRVAEHRFFKPEQTNAAGKVGEEMHQFMKKFQINDRVYLRSEEEILAENKRIERREERRSSTSKLLNSPGSKHGGTQSTWSISTFSR